MFSVRKQTFFFLFWDDKEIICNVLLFITRRTVLESFYLEEACAMDTGEIHWNFDEFSNPSRMLWQFISHRRYSRWKLLRNSTSSDLNSSLRLSITWIFLPLRGQWDSVYISSLIRSDGFFKPLEIQIKGNLQEY